MHFLLSTAIHHLLFFNSTCFSANSAHSVAFFFFFLLFGKVANMPLCEFQELSLCQVFFQLT